MPHELSHHTDYINRYGFWRWVLRECVRANPLYVISAALLAYGVMQLNTEIDPQIGKLRGIVLSLILLHVYEFAVLGAATIVLTRRTGGGSDLHGLMLVAGLFVSGSFLALDELIAISPALGFVLVPLGLMLVVAKSEWYARLPGIYLPWRYRIVVLGIIAGHSVSSLLGSADVKLRIGVDGAQRLAWLCGWLSMVPLLPLIWTESRRVREMAKSADQPTDRDPLITPRCGAGAIVMALGTGVAHLYASDWVFDRPADRLLLWPAISIIAAAWLLLRWQWIPSFSFWNGALATFPALMLQWVWYRYQPEQDFWSIAAILNPAPQFWSCCIPLYVGLALGTRRAEFYAGLLGPAGAPVWSWFWRARGSIPHFRAFVSVALGFLALIAGMFVSLFRERLLRWLDPAMPKPTEEKPA